MINLRKRNERGRGEHGWLVSKHSFSFAEYYDPRYMNFSALRVINEDKIAMGTGFGEHSHKNMEIVSYVIAGQLSHKDSMGNKAIIQPGEIQIMSAGSGVIHSEQNAEKGSTHFLQIWIIPEKENTPPSYGQKDFKEKLKKDKIALVLSKDGREDSLKIKQDVSIYLCALNTHDVIKREFKDKRKIYVQLIRGRINLLGLPMLEGDGAMIEEENELTFFAEEESEFIIFDLPYF